MARMTARGRARRFQGDTVTSPAYGAGSGADLPRLRARPPVRARPGLNDQGYYVGRAERNLYWVSDGLYQSAFLVTRDGVMVFDAPPSIGPGLCLAAGDIAVPGALPAVIGVRGARHDNLRDADTDVPLWRTVAVVPLPCGTR